MHWECMGYWMHQAYMMLLKDSKIWSTDCTIAWSVEWLFWKPNCLKYKILFLIKCLYKWLDIMHFMISEKHGSSAITTAIPLINQGDLCTVPIFKSSGKTPFSFEKINTKEFLHKLLKHFLIAAWPISFISWAYVNCQRISSIIQFIHWNYFGFHSNN